ncbi:terminase gpP N-terminus-related DNA-binding protein [Xanthobacter wiegelii]|uniref:terminase gpP N-terminus-related DNA-binding protein n=1 Tax=Xanthobacter wiegelii TaxID=3119913 RepID=UPI003727D328
MDQPHGSAVPSARPARGVLARRLYLEGASMAEIRRQTGLSSATVYYWIDRERGPDGTFLFNPVPRRTAHPVGGRPAKARTEKPSGNRSGKPDRRGLLKRLWRAAERQIDEIEGRLARAVDPGDEAPRPEPEKDARALAVLARTLRELTALEAETRKRRKAKDQDGTVRDLDTFRRELARRLDRLREGGDGAGVP